MADPPPRSAREVMRSATPSRWWSRASPPARRSIDLAVAGMATAELIEGATGQGHQARRRPSPSTVRRGTGRDASRSPRREASAGPARQGDEGRPERGDARRRKTTAEKADAGRRSRRPTKADAPGRRRPRRRRAKKAAASTTTSQAPARKATAKPGKRGGKKASPAKAGDTTNAPTGNRVAAASKSTRPTTADRRPSRPPPSRPRPAGIEGAGSQRRATPTAPPAAEGGRDGRLDAAVSSRPTRPWNVNSLNARLDRVEEWLADVEPDVVCMQETKLADDAFPPRLRRAWATRRPTTARAGGTGWPSCPVSASTTSSSTSPTAATPTPRPGSSRHGAASMRVAVSTCPTGAPSTTSTTSTSCAGWPGCAATSTPDAAGEPRVVAGDFNIAPTDGDVYDPEKFVGATHVSPPERAAARRRQDRAASATSFARTRERLRRVLVVGLPTAATSTRAGHAHRPRARSPSVADRVEVDDHRPQRSGKGQAPSDRTRRWW